MNSSLQLSLFPDEQPDTKPEAGAHLRRQRSGTFTDNMKLPVHQWFRYSAGFSAEWVQAVIERYKKEEPLSILDPFAGSGTTLLAADAAGQNCIGFETHPFIYRVAQAKLLWYLNPYALFHYADEVVQRARRSGMSTSRQHIPLLQKCYTEENLAKLDALREQYLKLRKEDDPIWELVWLILTAILRPCSTAGTAQWQYILPNKKKSKVLDPFSAFTEKAKEIAHGMLFVQRTGWKHNARMFLTDARNPNIPIKEAFDLVITSPPYPNNYDYADATRLEMTFWGEVSGWGDLQGAVRQHLVRSCSQHSAAERLTLSDLLADPLLAPIYKEVTVVCQDLEKIRESKGGRKTYHTMVAAYFIDLANVWRILRHFCKDGSTVCFVIGDCAPYGIYVPVDKWLGELALAAGFQQYRFEKIRDRNIKWKNRKHKIPLHEGQLWVEG
ncbi:MAG: DNA methyltransferase [bacterium]